jgi:thiamine transport system ATP-binding protein
MSLDVDHVTVTMDSTVVVDDVELVIHPGERFAIMGPSGAGKSTLLRVIAGLENASAGSITLDGVSIDTLPAHRRGVGLMFQDFALFAHLSVGDNVAYGPKIAGMRETGRAALVAELLEIVGLEGFDERSISSLSGGERQRVALARTLAPEPRVVLLDEPLGSVDQVLKDDLIREIGSILSERRVTSVYVTHDRHEAEAFADRVAIMRDGRIVRIGTPADVWDDPQTTFVARFMGHRSIIDAARVGQPPGVVLVHRSGVTIAARGDIEGVVRSTRFRDGTHRADVALAGGDGRDVIQVESVEALTPGTPVRLRIDPPGIRRLVVDD